MFARYLRRELSGRRKQITLSAIAIAMALAIGLVIIVNSLSAGVENAQASALESVYGVGTDVTATPTAPGEGERGPRFGFGTEGGSDTGARAVGFRPSRR